MTLLILQKLPHLHIETVGILNSGQIFHCGVYFALICFHLPPYLLSKGEVENLPSGSWWIYSWSIRCMLFEGRKHDCAGFMQIWFQMRRQWVVALLLHLFQKVSFSISPKTHAAHDVIGDRSCSSCSASLVCWFFHLNLSGVDFSNQKRHDIITGRSVLTDDRSLLLLQVRATGYKHCQWVVLHNILWERFVVPDNRTLSWCQVLPTAGQAQKWGIYM